MVCLAAPHEPVCRWMKSFDLIYLFVFFRFTGVAVCLFQMLEFLKKLDELVGKMTYENDPVKAQKPALQTRTNSLLQTLLKRSELLIQSYLNSIGFAAVIFDRYSPFSFLQSKVHLLWRLSLPCLKEKALWFCAQMSSSLPRQGQTCLFISINR